MIRRNTWILLAVFVVLVGATVYLQKSGNLNAASQSTPAPTELPLFKLDTGKFTRLTIQKSDAQALVAQLGSDGKWTISEPKGSAITSEQVESAVLTLKGWTVASDLNPVPPLEAMGLSSPPDMIGLTDQNGQGYRIAVGKQTPSGGGYYVQVEGGAPLIISKSKVDSVLQIVPLKATETATPGQGETAPPLTPVPTGPVGTP